MHLAPSLKIPDLIMALQPMKAIDEYELQKPWAEANDEVVWVSKSAWSLAAIALAKATHHAQSTDSRLDPVNVWLPAFFCNESLAPLRETGARLHFYNTNEQLDPDPESLEFLERTSSPDIIVGVHFFGMPANFENLLRHSLSSGAWLVEDATHVLGKRKFQGDQGDFVLFSPHKHLALPHGAILVIRNEGPNKLSELRESITRKVDDLQDQFEKFCNSKFQVTTWVTKRLINRLGIRRKPPESSLQNGSPISVGSIPENPQISWFAKRLLAQYVNRIEEISDSRKSNYETWDSYMSVLFGVKKLSDIGPSGQYIPYTAAFLERSETTSSEQLALLNQTGAQPTRWPDLPPEVIADSERFGMALEFFNQVVHLPTHQDVSHRNIARIGSKLVREVSESWIAKPVSEPDWDTLWQTAQAPNLIQSWQYGTALKLTRNSTVTRWVICDGFDRPIGLAQIVASKKFSFMGVQLVNQGPTWLGLRKVSAPQYAAMANVLRKGIKQLRAANGLEILVFSPPLEPSSDLVSLLKGLKFGKMSKESWASSRIDLRQAPDQIMANMDGKWRNGLKKGQRSALHIRESDKFDQDWTAVREIYSDLILPRDGLTTAPEVFDALISQTATEAWKVQLFLAGKLGPAGDETLLSAILVVKSGQVSTYLMGVSTEEGRRMNATSVLLWEALNKQKEIGAAWFDLGGMSTETPAGILRFKEGLGGESYSTGGYYWSF